MLASTKYIKFAFFRDRENHDGNCCEIPMLRSLETAIYPACTFSTTLVGSRDWYPLVPEKAKFKNWRAFPPFMGESW